MIIMNSKVVIPLLLSSFMTTNINVIDGFHILPSSSSSKRTMTTTTMMPQQQQHQHHNSFVQRHDSLLKMSNDEDDDEESSNNNDNLYEITIDTDELMSNITNIIQGIDDVPFFSSNANLQRIKFDVPGNKITFDFTTPGMGQSDMISYLKKFFLPTSFREYLKLRENGGLDRNRIRTIGVGLYSISLISSDIGIDVIPNGDDYSIPNEKKEEGEEGGEGEENNNANAVMNDETAITPAPAPEPAPAPAPPEIELSQDDDDDEDSEMYFDDDDDDDDTSEEEEEDDNPNYGTRLVVTIEDKDLATKAVDDLVWRYSEFLECYAMVLSAFPNAKKTSTASSME